MILTARIEQGIRAMGMGIHNGIWNADSEEGREKSFPSANPVVRPDRPPMKISWFEQSTLFASIPREIYVVNATRSPASTRT
jgi:hypothetical protein